jgi:hypothetical protein
VIPDFVPDVFLAVLCFETIDFVLYSPQYLGISPQIPLFCQESPPLFPLFSPVFVHDVLLLTVKD